MITVNIIQFLRKVFCGYRVIAIVAIFNYKSRKAICSVYDCVSLVRLRLKLDIK